MPTLSGAQFADLPEAVGRGLSDFLDSAQSVFGTDLRAAILYGSAAEGRLRATSDVNLMLVLAAFDQAKASAIRETYMIAHVTIKLKVMFVLEMELQSAAEAFAQKFTDILHRRRVLLGPDPLEAITIPRTALLTRLRQVLLNLTLRLREHYVSHGTRPERLAAIISETAGPLRTSAAALLELEGGASLPPKEALEKVAASLNLRDWVPVLRNISQARETGLLAADDAESTLMAIIGLAEQMHARVAAIS